MEMLLQKSLKNQFYIKYDILKKKVNIVKHAPYCSELGERYNEKNIQQVTIYNNKNI